MNGHILIQDISTSDAAVIRSKIEEVVREQFNIIHTTFQMECQKCSPADLFCSLTEDDKSGECKQEESKR